MNSLEGLKVCAQCNHKIINYPNQCRRQFLPLSQHQSNQSCKTNDHRSSGDSKLDEFIKETQINSKYCDDFIEWIPYSNLENIKFLANGGNSKVYRGTWNLLLPTNIALKAIRDSNNIDKYILNEFKMHHKCRSQGVIPFYGITNAPKGDEYAMVIQYAEHGDLRNYIRKFFPNLTWTDKAKILLNLSKALNFLHQMNLLHKDFHCKNLLVDKDNKVFISDFGLCQPIDSEIVSNSIQGVLPYIAPEVLRYKPYTRQSEVYSMSMIMWELTSNKPPFTDDCHDANLALAVIDGKRPNIIEGTPDFYSKIMQQCWDSDPLQRPDAPLLPTIFEEMIELCKMIDNNTYSSKINFCVSPQPNPVTDSNEISIESEYKTKAFEYTLKTLTCSSESKEKISAEKSASYSKEYVFEDKRKFCDNLINDAILDEFKKNKKLNFTFLLFIL